MVLFDQFMQLGQGKKKRIASFKVKRKFSFFLLFPISQARLLLAVALLTCYYPTQNKCTSCCMVGWHSVVNIIPLKNHAWTYSLLQGALKDTVEELFLPVWEVC